MEEHDLAIELLENMQKLDRAKLHRSITDSLHGGDFMLLYIARHHGMALPSEISHEVGISTARVAVALNNMEKKELLTREIDIQDRRRIIVKLTDKGKEVVKTKQAELKKSMSMLLSTLSEDDAKEYVRLTGLLAKNIVGLRMD